MKRTTPTRPRSILDVTDTDIRHLDDVELVDLMRNLLRSEASLMGIPLSQIQVSRNIKAPDEGCDGWSPQHSGRGDWLPQTDTCWQFKSGTAGERKHLKEEVGKKIPRDTLQRGGSYIVVASGASGKSQMENRLDAIRAEAATLSLPTDKIRVYTADLIAAWCTSLPSVAAGVVGLPRGFFRFEDLAADSRYAQPYHESEKVQAEIRAAQQGIVFADGTIHHLHIHGPPGVGKTRRAIEIVRHESIQNFVFYFGCYASFVLDFLGHVKDEASKRIVCVVDEIQNETQVKLLNPYSRLANGRIRIITIGSYRPIDRQDIHLTEVEPLAPEQMRPVVRGWATHLAREHVDYVVKIADGYVKLARIVAETIEREGNIKPLDLFRERHEFGGFLELLLAGLDESARESLRIVSLFKILGWEGDREDEGQIVAEQLGIDWNEVRRGLVIAERRFGIVQSGGRYIYISPKPLALYLALDAWDCHGDRLSDLPARFPRPEMADAFYERLSEIARSPDALKFCQKALARYDKMEAFSNPAGARIWSHIALADPADAASGVRRVLESSSYEKKLEFKEGRRDIIWTLIKLAWRGESFEDSMLALAELAVAENENIMNNATGEFCSKFQLALGGTSVCFNDRLKVIDTLLNRQSTPYMRLVIKALSQALKHDQFRMGGAEDQGLTVVQPEWRPNVDELIAAVRDVVHRLKQLASQKSPELEPDFVEVAGKVYSDLIHGGFFDVADALIRTLADSYPSQKEKLYFLVRRELDLDILRHEKGKLPANPFQDRIQNLLESLKDDSFIGRLHRIAGPYEFHTEERLSEPELVELADEIVKCRTLIDGHIAWLTSGEANGSWELGLLLGERDGQGLLLNRFLSGTPLGPDLRILSAYLKAHSEKHQSVDWLDEWLDRMMENPQIEKRVILDITWRCTPTAGGARRVIEMVRNGSVPPPTTACLSMGPWGTQIPVSVFVDLLGEMLKHPEHRSTTAALIGHRIRFRKQDVPLLLDFAKTIATDEELIRSHQMDSHYWSEAAQLVLDTHARAIAGAIFNAQRPGGHWFIEHSNSRPVLEKCVETDPMGVWEELSKILLDRERRPFFVIGFPKTIVDRLPLDTLLEWCAVDPEDRAPTLAKLASPKFGDDKSLAARLADRYGDMQRVDSALYGILIDGASWGPISNRWKGRAEELENAAKSTKLPGLRVWARKTAAEFRDMEAGDRLRETEEELRRG